MKTILTQFCEDFDGRVRPLLQPLDGFADQLRELPPESPLKKLLPEVVDVRHQLRTLVEKVAEQQAYVIIFGPLKSGKSTLMNALAAAYVSEVTTLPAYPCMVYVANGPEEQFTVTRYDGNLDTFDDLDSMRSVIEAAHGDLAGSIREVEGHGEDFDPALHMPRALRRVDVRMPAEPLAESGAVLVDTPGLYSRMKFGYDLMTREFRDSAASAIFVVKTDNLFLEQVFDEFSDLLRMFSRIFLIVNLDGTKQDLQPDGELGPSLERRDPQRIIDAFESLAMNAELKLAWEEGRLQIYPIDLLKAASQRLRGDDPTVADEAEGADPMLASFGGFTDDLTHYLNSTEYLTAFLGDSLRQADHLVSGLQSVCDSEPVHELAQGLGKWDAERERSQNLLRSVHRLQKFPWDETLARMREDVVRITRERTGDLRKETAEAAESALARWYDGDASYASLVQEDLAGVLSVCRDGMIERARDVASTVLSSDVASAMVRRDANDDLALVGLSVAAVAGQLEGTVRSAAEDRSVAPEIPTRLIPVRRKLVDWLLLRSQAGVRRTVFGPDDSPTRPIPRIVKQRRLGAGRVALGEIIRSRIDMFFAETLKRVTGEVFGAHVAAVCRQVEARLETLESENASRLATAEETRQSLVGLRMEVDRLAETLGAANEDITRLAAAYGEAVPQEKAASVGEDAPADGADTVEATMSIADAPTEQSKPEVRAAAAAAGAGGAGDSDES